MPAPESWSLRSAIGAGKELLLACGSRLPRAGPKDGEIEVEQVTLRPYGFEPRAIKRPKGDFLLSFSNRSRQKDLALQLFRVVGISKGEKLKDVGLPKGVVNRLTTLSLQPGEYVLSEASNPRWECRLTITAQ